MFKMSESDFDRVMMMAFREEISKVAQEGGLSDALLKISALANTAVKGGLSGIESLLKKPIVPGMSALKAGRGTRFASNLPIKP
jgi:hypothetical protein